jgi:hypothetical protein
LNFFSPWQDRELAGFKFLYFQGNTSPWEGKNWVNPWEGKETQSNFFA